MLFSVGLVKLPKISLNNFEVNLPRASKKLGTKLSNTSGFSARTFKGPLAEQPISCGKAKFFSTCTDTDQIL